jgi:hypothetical protein
MGRAYRKGGSQMRETHAPNEPERYHSPKRHCEPRIGSGSWLGTTLWEASDGHYERLPGR